MRLRRASGRRVSWSIADQGLSSISNFVLAMLIARTVSLEAFGRFSLVYSIYMFVMGASRALFSEPLLSRDRRVQSEMPPTLLRGSVAGAGLVGLLAGGLVVGAALLVPAAGPEFLALGSVLPGLLLQDAYRFAMVSNGNSRAAAMNDGLWMLLQIGAIVWVSIRGANLATLVLVWGLSGGLSGIVGLTASSLRPDIRDARTLLRTYRVTSLQYLAEFIVGGGTLQVGLWVIGVVAGFSVLGALRAGITILGPIRVLIMAAPMAFVPELTRLRGAGQRRFERSVGFLIGTLAVSILVWGQLSLLVPEAVGRELFGASWEAGRGVIVPMSLYLAATAAFTGLQLGLRALEDSRRSLIARVATAPPLLVGGAIGAAMGAAVGAAYGRALGAALASIYWYVSFRRSTTSNFAQKDGESVAAGG